MANRIRSLLEEVEYTYLKIGSLFREAYQLRKEGKRGKAQSLSHTIKYLKRKMFYSRERFKSIIKGNVCFIKYQVQDEKGNTLNKEAILANMNNEEIKDVISIYCRFNDLTLIKVLEIKRISTKLG